MPRAARLRAPDAPFSQTYVVNLGEDLETDDFAAAADKLAKYLYCNTVTAAGAFFDKCRSEPTPDGLSAGADAGLRTFGLAQLGFSYDDIPAAAVDESVQGTGDALAGRRRRESRSRPLRWPIPPRCWPTISPPASRKRISGPKWPRA